MVVLVDKGEGIVVVVVRCIVVRSTREDVRPGLSLPMYAPRIMRSISVSPSLGRSRL